MFISREKYEKLCDRVKLVDELEKECQRLADVISAEVKDCKIGVWCKNCVYLKKEKAEVKGHIGAYSGCPETSWVKECAGEVYYCDRHLREMCPDFFRKIRS